MSSVYRIRDLDHLDAIYEGREQGFIYARDGHPNAETLAAKLADLDGAEAAAISSSGMGATAAVLLDRLRPGDHAVIARELYGKTLHLLGTRLAAFGVQVQTVDINDLLAVEAALQSKPKILWTESLSNPLMRAARIDELSALARLQGAMFVVDATFTPPPILHPMKLGAGVVVHSLTKILSGHSDVTLGSVAGAKTIIDSVRATASVFGYASSPFDCWLTERGLSTLVLRIERASANALAIAEFLQSRKDISSVHYPGLASHPDHAWMTSNAASFGFMLSFEVAGGRERVNRLFQNLRLVPFCPSLGDVQTTVSHPATTSHRGMTPAERERLGIRAGLVRVSVGIESANDVIADFRQGLDRA